MATPRTPGWYPDPDGEDALRWFDGGAWTDLYADLPSTPKAAPEPEPEPQPEPQPEPEPEPEAPAPDPIPLPVAVPEPEPQPELPPAAAAPAELEPDPAAVAAAREARLAAMREERLAAAREQYAASREAALVEEPARPRRRVPRALLYGAALLAVAGVAAGATVVLTGEDDPKPVKRATAPTPDPECLRVWNTTDTAAAADLRVTVGQFEDSYARVSRVQPLPGTVMQPNSCALTIYQPDTATHMILIAGVKDQVGYVDATTYPRAATLGWPRSIAESNVTVQPDGTVRAIRR